MPYLLLAINIGLMTIGQLLFKQSAIFFNNNEQLNFFYKFLFNPWFYGAISFFAISTFTWVRLLTLMRISVAYPILSLSYILTAVGAFFIFGEKLSVINIFGISIIMLGVSLISIRP